MTATVIASLTLALATWADAAEHSRLPENSIRIRYMARGPRSELSSRTRTLLGERAPLTRKSAAVHGARYPQLTPAKARLRPVEDVAKAKSRSTGSTASSARGKATAKDPAEKKPVAAKTPAKSRRTKATGTAAKATAAKKSTKAAASRGSSAASNTPSDVKVDFGPHGETRFTVEARGTSTEKVVGKLTPVMKAQLAEIGEGRKTLAQLGRAFAKSLKEQQAAGNTAIAEAARAQRAELKSMHAALRRAETKATKLAQEYADGRVTATEEHAQKIADIHTQMAALHQQIAEHKAGREAAEHKLTLEQQARSVAEENAHDRGVLDAQEDHARDKFAWLDALGNERAQHSRAHGKAIRAAYRAIGGRQAAEAQLAAEQGIRDAVARAHVNEAVAQQTLDHHNSLVAERDAHSNAIIAERDAHSSRINAERDAHNQELNAERNAAAAAQRDALRTETALQAEQELTPQRISTAVNEAQSQDVLQHNRELIKAHNRAAQAEEKALAREAAAERDNLMYKLKNDEANRRARMKTWEGERQLAFDREIFDQRAQEQLAANNRTLEHERQLMGAREAANDRWYRDWMSQQRGGDGATTTRRPEIDERVPEERADTSRESSDDVMNHVRSLVDSDPMSAATLLYNNNLANTPEGRQLGDTLIPNLKAHAKSLVRSSKWKGSSGREQIAGQVYDTWAMINWLESQGVSTSAAYRLNPLRRLVSAPADLHRFFRFRRQWELDVEKSKRGVLGRLMRIATAPIRYAWHIPASLLVLPKLLFYPAHDGPGVPQTGGHPSAYPILNDPEVAPPSQQTDDDAARQLGGAAAIRKRGDLAQASSRNTQTVVPPAMLGR